jgi:hypothetical protein
LFVRVDFNQISAFIHNDSFLFDKLFQHFRIFINTKYAPKWRIVNQCWFVADSLLKREFKVGLSFYARSKNLRIIRTYNEKIAYNLRIMKPL